MTYFLMGILVFMVGVAGFEPAISPSRTGRDTRLRYTPMRSGRPDSNWRPLGSKPSRLPLTYALIVSNADYICFVVHSLTRLLLFGHCIDTYGALFHGTPRPAEIERSK